ncbi:hypothetical protein [Streptomyces sp. NPDC031705]|uniref:hypothetical protein n=1 Tax=Streptomyces sp. NPDC031705 TaxID=3155729 RepID=UPI0033DB830C
MSDTSAASPRRGALLLHFPPIENAIDYLSSAVQHLHDGELEGTTHGLKYAVLHLQAAVEVSLKYRLLHEHWTLVTEDPAKADRKRFDADDFKTCTLDQAVDRLRRIVGVAITDDDHQALKRLSRDRNALQHFGFTHRAPAVEARAAAVLDFLLRFIDAELVPLIPDGERATFDIRLRGIRNDLADIGAYVTKSMNSLRSVLAEHHDRLARCPLCDQVALVISPGRSTCHFCRLEGPTEGWINGLFKYETRVAAGPCPSCGDYRHTEEMMPFATRTTDLYCHGCDTEFGRCAGCKRYREVRHLETGNEPGSGHCRDCHPLPADTAWSLGPHLPGATPPPGPGQRSGPGATAPTRPVRARPRGVPAVTAYAPRPWPVRHAAGGRGRRPPSGPAVRLPRRQAWWWTGNGPPPGRPGPGSGTRARPVWRAVSSGSAGSRTRDARP